MAWLYQEKKGTEGIKSFKKGTEGIKSFGKKGTEGIKSFLALTT